MNVLGSFGIVFLLNILEYIISPFTTMLITKSLSVSDYGIYSLLLSMSGLIFSFFTLGLSQYNCKIIPGREEDEQYEVLGQSISYEFISALIGVVFLCLFYQKKIDNKVIILFFIIKTLLSVIINEIIRFFGYQKKNVTKSIISFIDSKLWFVPLLFLFLLKKVEISNIFIVQGFNSVIVLIICLFLLNSESLLKNLPIRKKFLTNVIKCSISFVFIDIGMYLLEMASRYILSIEATMESVGYFSFAYSWISILFKFSMLLVYLLQPYFSESFYKASTNEKYFDRYKKYTKIAFKYSFYILFCAMFVLLMYYDRVVILIGKKDYLSTYNSVLAMSVLPIFMFFAYFFQIILLLCGKAKVFPVCYLIMAILNIILNLVFVRYFDYFASSLICSISYGILSLMFFIICPKKYIKHLITLKDVIEVIIVVSAIVVFCLFIKRFLGNTMVSLLLSIIVIVIHATIVLIKNKEDIRFLREV